ncbi:MAG: hypothetical protein ACKVZJ_13830 [Phycisphaerales bacterium]
MHQARLDPELVLERMVNAVEQVRLLMLRACGCLRSAGVPYAVVGGNAVAAWVATVDEGAVRNTRDVDVLIRRSDFDAAKRAMETCGFVHRRAAGIDVFLDGPSSSARQGVHVVFADETVRAGEPVPNPSVDESTDIGPIRVIDLAALVRIKLTAFRDKDRTHVRDLIEVGLIDRTWVDRLPPPLADRLRLILDSPDG